MLTVDYDFVDAHEMKTVAGRSFSRDIPGDATSSFVLSRTAAEDLGWTPGEALGREIWWDEWGADSLRKGHVIGVLEDFHVASLHEEIRPMVLLMQESSAGQL